MLTALDDNQNHLSCKYVHLRNPGLMVRSLGGGKPHGEVKGSDRTHGPGRGAWTEANGSAWLMILLALLLWPWGSFAAAAPAMTQSSAATADIYVFWREGCPHCGREKDFLRRLVNEEPRLRIHELEISQSQAHFRAFQTLVGSAGIDKPGVPLTVIGQTLLQGYQDDSTTGAEIRRHALSCLTMACPDSVRPLLENPSVSGSLPAKDWEKSLPKVLKLPLFGDIAIAEVSLPVLTILLGAIDGFNPCAMWTLVFLISLLVGLRDRFRMWVLGGAFIAASAAVYYLFMAAWLNLLLFLGMLVWIRVLIGLLALGGGGYYLHEYFMNPEAICKVTAPESRRRILDRLRHLVGERNFLLALGGIILLAFVVNAVELICSAGLPAIYTQVLAMSHLPVWQYHAYLALYILVFMLDDLLVFFVAMQTLKVTGLTGAYVRQAHLIGGVVMILLGLMLLFQPDWLSFT